MSRFLTIVLVACLILAGVVGYRWYSYVSNTQSPFEEVGIELNSRMPGPIRDWGCARLKQTFGAKTLPPYGCSTSDGRSWQ